MLTKDQASEAVSRKLRQMSPSDDLFVVIDDETMERPFGWVFFYNSKTYLETDKIRYALAGNGPVIVNKTTGEILFCGSSKPVEELIQDYESKL